MRAGTRVLRIRFTWPNGTACTEPLAPSGELREALLSEDPQDLRVKMSFVTLPGSD